MATKVLIVDYEPKRITEVSNHLAGLAVEILSARDGIAAIETFHQLAPDLVILCAMLPKKHGFQVCQEIKADPRGAHTPVIIHSSVYKGTKHRLDALNTYGASEFLEYPFTRETLVGAVLKLRPELDGGTHAKSEAGDSSSSATMQMTSPFATAGVPAPAAVSPEADTAKIKPADLAAAVGATGASIAFAAATAKKKASADLDKLLEDTLSGVRKASKAAAPKPVVEAAPAPSPAPKPVPPLAPEPAPVVVAPPMPEPPQPAAPPPPQPASIPATLRETVRSRPINTADLEKKLNDTLSGLRASSLSKKTTGSLQVPPAAPAPVPPAAPPSDAASAKTEVLSAVEKKKTSGVFKSPPGPAEIRLGNFVLGERIATGGMAELFKARQRGVDGFEKTVAIKRILPHLATNAEFTTMFIDEAKLASQLNHPNIAQIYDLGKTDGAYYIAMEYVDGKDLREINRVMVEHHGHFTPAGAGAIVAKILAALSHAHAKKDENGRSLKLVHRDVSPQNILINGEGEIKLVDFGIAKAAAKTQNTQSGALKGKLLYMSPEQAWGRPDIDNRSDLYAAGIILWELLAGRRLYNGDSEMGILDKVREALVPDIREFNPDVTPELAEILGRALAKERDDRYGDARQFQNELENQLTQEYGEAPSSVWVLSALHGLFPTAYRHDGEPRPVRRPPAPSRKAAASPPPPPPPPQPPPPQPPAAIPAPEPEPDPAPTPKPKAKTKPRNEPPARPAPPPAPSGEAAFGGSLGMEPPAAKKSALPLILGGVGLAAVIGIGIVFMKGKGSSAVSVAGNSGSSVVSPPASSAGSSAANASAVGASVAAIPSTPQTASPSTPRSTAGSTAHSAAESSPREKAAAEKAAAEKAAAEKAAAEKAAAEKAAADKAAADKAAADKAAADRAAAEAAASAAAASAAKTVKPGDFVAYPQLDREPTQVSKPDPQIPGAAASKTLSGVVIVSITIDDKGQVINASLVRGLSPDYGVNQACVEAARKMKFTPGIKDGVPVKTTKTVSYSLRVGGG